MIPEAAAALDCDVDVPVWVGGGELCDVVDFDELHDAIKTAVQAIVPTNLALFIPVLRPLDPFGSPLPPRGVFRQTIAHV